MSKFIKINLFFLFLLSTNHYANSNSNRVFHRNAGNPSITSEHLQIPFRASHRGLNVNVQNEEVNSAPGPSSRKIEDFDPPPIVVGGLKASNAESSFHASIRYIKSDEPFGRGHTCSGCLINAKNVLTAAHCFFAMDRELGNAVMLDAVNFEVVLGSLQRFRKRNSTYHQRVHGYTFHENYNYATNLNDIGIIELESVIPASLSSISPIAIATEKSEPGTKCRVSGFGASPFQEKDANDLLITTVKLYSKDNCKNVYGTKLFDGMICAGDWYGKFRLCEADSGGPLVCNNALYGIISWGVSCDKTMLLPGIYTELYHYREWIDSHTFTAQRSTFSQLPNKGNYRSFSRTLSSIINILLMGIFLRRTF